MQEARSLDHPTRERGVSENTRELEGPDATINGGDRPDLALRSKLDRGTTPRFLTLCEAPFSRIERHTTQERPLQALDRFERYRIAKVRCVGRSQRVQDWRDRAR